MKNKKVRLSIIIFVIIAVVFQITFVTINVLKDDEQKQEINESYDSEVIRVISQDETVMLDNIGVKNKLFKKYLVFDIVRMNKNIKNVNFDIKLLLDGDVVFKENIVIDNFNDKDSINKEILLEDFKYNFEDLSVDFIMYK